MTERKRLQTWIAASALGATLACAASAWADLEGSADHPLLKRYEGSTIVGYSTKAFDEYVLPLGPATGINSLARLTKSERLEGRVTRITYLAPAGRSTLEVLRNYESELRQIGFRTLFRGADAELGNASSFTSSFADAAGYRKIPVGSNLGTIADHALWSTDERYLAARWERPEGVVHVAVYLLALHQQSLGLHPLRGFGEVVPGQVLAQVDVVEAAPMETRMVTVSASEMARALETSGSVSLYGIYFDTDSATVKPESEPTLVEIAALLKSRPRLELLVVGHTDNVGTLDHNLDLSRRRAEAVVRALVSGQGVAAGRLTPLGVAFASPKAPNRTEEGRADNRRVELVER